MRLKALAIWFLLAASAIAAPSYRTANFIVTAPTPQAAQEIGDAAEHWRVEMAKYWLGKEMPPWAAPCPIFVRLARGAGGATTFTFKGGEVYGWRMNIQGSRTRILDSVLPHEVSHTVFASYFRQPLPRWADEGACCTVEGQSEQARYQREALTFLYQRRLPALDRLFAMRDYPPDVMPLYAQGHALSKFFVAKSSPQKFIAFIADGLSDDNWPRAVKAHYGYDSLDVLTVEWRKWMKHGQQVEHTVAFNGWNCPNGQCYGGNAYQNAPRIMYQQQPQQYYQQPQYVQPSRPQPIQPTPDLRPIADPTVTTTPPQPTPDQQAESDAAALGNMKADIISQATANATADIKVLIDNRLADIKGCNCPPGMTGCDCSGKWPEWEAWSAKVDQRLTKIEADIATINNTKPPEIPTVPTYDEIAAEMQKLLTHAAEITLLDGTVKPQVRPLNKPLEFIQHSRDRSPQP